MKAVRVWSSSNVGFLENTFSWEQLEVDVSVSQNRIESKKPPLDPIHLPLIDCLSDLHDIT